MPEPIIRTKAKIRFIEFLRPGCFWPYPYTLEQAIGVYSWMADSAVSHFRKRHHNPVFALLGCQPSCLFSELKPITGIDNLRQCFHYALLDSVGSQVAEWKAKNGIAVDGSRMIGFRHHEYGTGPACEASMKTGLDSFLELTGTLTPQLNEYHADARNILGVKLTYCTYSRGWRFELEYGVDGSVWTYPLAQQRKGQTFYECFAAARRHFDCLQQPDYQAPPKWAVDLSTDLMSESLTTRSSV